MAIVVTVVGEGNIVDVTRWESTQRLNAGGQFSFSLPATSEGAALIGALAEISCSWKGVEVAAGIISAWNVADGVMNVRGEDMARELATVVVNGVLEDAGGGMTLYDAIEWIGAELPVGWTLDNDVSPSNPAVIYFEAVNDSLLAVLGAVCELGGCWFTITGKTLRVADTLGSVRHGVTLLSLAQAVDAADVVNKIYLTGAGSGEAALDLGPATDSAPSGYTLDAAESSLTWDDSPYPLRERVVALGWIGPQEASDAAVEAAANALLQGGVKWLEKYATPIESYSAAVAYPGVIAPLECVALHWRGRGLVVNAAPAVVESRLMIEPDSLVTVALTLEGDARRIPSDAEVIAQTMLDANRRRTWPQLELASDTLEGEGLIADSSTSVNLTMTWPERVVQVRSVSLELTMTQTDAAVQLPTSLEYRFNGTGSWVAYSAPIDILAEVADAASGRPDASSFVLNVRGVAPSEKVKAIGASISGGTALANGDKVRTSRPFQLVSVKSNEAGWTAGTNKIADIPAGSIISLTGGNTDQAGFDGTNIAQFFPVTLGELAGYILIYEYRSDTLVIQPYPAPPSGGVTTGRFLSTAYYSAQVRARVSVRASALAQ